VRRCLLELCFGIAAWKQRERARLCGCRLCIACTFRLTLSIRGECVPEVSPQCLQPVGLETGTGSSDYIQLYHGDANLLKESLEVVQRTSTVILGAINPKDAVRAAAIAEVQQ
jgi:hypothetical protein